ncbi:MAG: head maturation protease, ClpP-related [Prevotella sp.]
MSKKLYNMIPGNDSCCILLYGDIGDYDDVRSGDVARELLNAKDKHIDVRINSNGGEVYCGIAIFNALRNSNADISIYVDGIAASMASVIALCGKHVEMSKYARLMLHSVSGGCYGNKKDLQKCIDEITGLESTICDMYSEKTGMSKEDIVNQFFDGEDHWLTAEEALALGFIDGIYDADPVPIDSTPEQIYSIFNNRLDEPKTKETMNIEELKKRPQFKDCVTEDDVLKRIGQLEADSAKFKDLSEENTSLKSKVQSFEDKAKQAEEKVRKDLLDKAEEDGRIDAKTRPTYENILKANPEDGKKVLESLQPKRNVMTDIRKEPGAESPWDKRMQEIKENRKR